MSPNLRQFIGEWLLFMAGGMIFLVAAFIDERMGNVEPLSWLAISYFAIYGAFCLIAGIYLQKRRVNP